MLASRLTVTIRCNGYGSRANRRDIVGVTRIRAEEYVRSDVIEMRREKSFNGRDGYAYIPTLPSRL